MIHRRTNLTALGVRIAHVPISQATTVQSGEEF